MNVYRLMLVFVGLVSCVKSPEPVESAVHPVEVKKPVKHQPTVRHQPVILNQPAMDSGTRAVVKPGQITGVQVDRLFAMQQSGELHLIDVRPPLYYRLGQIEGAVNFPLIKYEGELAEHRPQIAAALASGKTVVLYCQNVNCPDAYRMARKLVKYGYDLSVYKGGWQEWKRAGLAR